MKNASLKLNALYITLIIGVLVALIIPAIPQDAAYHDFADQRQILGTSHFWNVISNLPFIIVSYIAVNNLLQGGVMKFPHALFSCYLIFFIGIGTVGIGSAYYHLQPTNETLFWDRLPMTVGFMAFMSIIIGEFISEKVASKLMFPMILIGPATVIYWHFTEQTGQGDLRAYGLIQFLPMLIIPMILLMFPARYTHTGYLWAMLAAYLLAKIFEFFDAGVFNMIGMSGHAIKHVFAAIAPYLFYLEMKKRSLLSGNK